MRSLKLPYSFGKRHLWHSLQGSVANQTGDYSIGNKICLSKWQRIVLIRDNLLFFKQAWCKWRALLRSDGVVISWKLLWQADFMVNPHPLSALKFAFILSTPIVHVPRCKLQECPEWKHLLTGNITGSSWWRNDPCQSSMNWTKNICELSCISIGSSLV